jgi:hypothetical protein
VDGTFETRGTSEMRRITITAALAAAAVLALAGTASADVGDIDDFEVHGDESQGTATAAEISGDITCTTTIEYGIVLHVAQDDASDAWSQDADNDAEVEGVGAFGPNSDPGNNPNSPCSTSNQDWELVVQVNRDSDPYQDGTLMGVQALAGTSANDGERGPGPFVGDLAYEEEQGSYDRTDP